MQSVVPLIDVSRVTNGQGPGRFIINDNLVDLIGVGAQGAKILAAGRVWRCRENSIGRLIGST